MKRGALTGGIILLSLVIQSVFFQFIEIRGIKPDLLLIVIISFTLIRGEGKNGAVRGAILGISAGLIQDLLYSDILGLNALSKFLTGLLVGYSSQSVFKGNIIIPFIITFLATVFNGFIYYIALIVISIYIPFKPFTLQVFYEAVYNTVLSVFVYNGLKKLEELV